MGFHYCYLDCNRRRTYRKFVWRAFSDPGSSDEAKRTQKDVIVEAKGDKMLLDMKNRVGRLQETIASLPPVVFLVILIPIFSFS